MYCSLRSDIIKQAVPKHNRALKSMKTTHRCAWKSKAYEKYEMDVEILNQYGLIWNVIRCWAHLILILSELQINCAITCPDLYLKWLDVQFWICSNCHEYMNVIHSLSSCNPRATETANYSLNAFVREVLCQIHTQSQRLCNRIKMLSWLPISYVTKLFICHYLLEFVTVTEVYTDKSH